jgi:hypothetical protein
MAGNRGSNKGNRVPGMAPAQETVWFQKNRVRRRKRNKVAKASRKRNR